MFGRIPHTHQIRVQHLLPMAQKFHPCFVAFQHFSVFVFLNKNKNQKSWIENSPGKLHLFTTAISPQIVLEGDESSHFGNVFFRGFYGSALALPKLLFGLAISLGDPGTPPKKMKDAPARRHHLPNCKGKMASSKQQFSGGYYGICFEKSGGKKSLKINHRFGGIHPENPAFE